MPISPIVRGTEHIPARGPCILVGNHYERPGLWMAWSALIVGRAVYERTNMAVHWIAITEWEDYHILRIPIPPRVTRFVFARFHETFGFIGMPPETAPTAERAAGIRRAIAVIRGGGIVGIFPEGTIGPTPVMLPARAGSGLFVQSLCRGGAVILPAGIFEDDGRLTVQFGQTFRLDSVPDADKRAQDECARSRIMRAIAALVPPALRGPHGGNSTEEQPH